MRLLERTTRRISLTSAGRSILSHCQRVALEVEAARAALQPVSNGAQLLVAIDQSFGRLLVAPLVPRFLERFPQVTLRVINVEEVAEGAPFDVELRSDGRKADGEVVSSLGTPPMIRAPRRYLAGVDSQTPSELGQHSVLWAAVARQPTCDLQRWRCRCGARTPRLVAQDSLRRMRPWPPALNGALPEFMCRNGLAMKRLVLLPDWEVQTRSSHGRKSR
jgi:DNA-binding transcriptional LysR family regulator